MPRAGLDRAAVVEAAAALADRDGLAGFSLADLAARLNVRPPSLYNHVAGLAGLKRDLALLGLRTLGQRLTHAAVAKTADDGIVALADAYRGFVHDHPGLHEATLTSYRLFAPTDPDLAAAEAAAFEPVLAVLASAGLTGADAIHAARGLRSIAHGFATLEQAGGFGIPLDRDESFRRLVRAYAAGLRTGAREG